jgi:hypothetical protein
MPSTSKSQQRLMGMAYAVKSKEMQLSDIDAAYRDKVAELVDSMTLKDLKDFASTPHEDLPETKESLELNEINLKSVGMKEFIKKVSDRKDIIDKLGFNKLKDLIAYLQGGSLEDWEELRAEGAALGIVVESEEVNERLKMLMNPLMLKIMKQFGFDRDPQIKAELREAIKAAVEQVFIKHDIIVEANDHEVGMAMGQLEAIINAAMDLEEKIGQVEKDLPGWIQDHISQSYNFIKQANDSYHELQEDLGAVNPSMLKGMGSPSLPSADSVGSGDVPAGQAKKKKKGILDLNEFIKEQEQLKAFEPKQGEGEALGEGEYEVGSANSPDEEMAAQAQRHRRAANVITFQNFTTRR